MQATLHERTSMPLLPAKEASDHVFLNTFRKADLSVIQRAIETFESDARFVYVDEAAAFGEDHGGLEDLIDDIPAHELEHYALFIDARDVDQLAAFWPHLHATRLQAVLSERRTMSRRAA